MNEEAKLEEKRRKGRVPLCRLSDRNCHGTSVELRRIPCTMYGVRQMAWLGKWQLRSDWISRLGRNLRLGIPDYFYHTDGKLELFPSFFLSSLASSFIGNPHVLGALSLPSVCRAVTVLFLTVYRDLTP